jgi:putative membrane protein
MVKYDLKSLAVKWLAYSFLLFLTVKTVKGLNINCSGFQAAMTLVFAAAVIAMLNTFIKPVIILLTLPLNILSFGLFTMVVNAVVFFLAGWIVRGFEVRSFWAAIIGSFVYSILTMIAGSVISAVLKSKSADGREIKADFKIIE